MGTFFVGTLLAVLIGFIIRYLVRQWKAGNGLCGGDCKTCGHCEGIRRTDAAEQGCTGNCAACKASIHQKQH